MPPVIVPPQSPRQISTLQTIPHVSKATPIPSLIVGEKLNVLVLSSLEHNALLRIKNSTLLAYSPLPLQSGETLMVRVDQLHPMIVLYMIPRNDEEISKMNSFLKLYRSNPAAMKELITTLKDFLSHDSLAVLAKYVSKEEIQNMTKVLEKIIVSKKNITAPLFLKDSIVALGLAGERRLMKSLSDIETLGNEKNNPTLKGILLKLSSELTPISVTSEYIESDTQKIGQFCQFAGHAATVIESLQIVNILSQEQDGLFLFQFPFQFPDGVRMQDLYIESDRNSKKDEPEKKYRIVLFLDMDTLGEMAVDAGIQDKAIRCTLKCSDQFAFDFLQTLLPELHKALSGIDYTLSSVQCILDRNIQSWKNDFLNNRSLYSKSVIDVCV
jgi:hypothetical protein